VDPDDQPAVSAALSRLLEESGAEAEARRDRARSFIASNFSSDASMRKYFEAWHNNIAAAGAAKVEMQLKAVPVQAPNGSAPPGAE